MSRIDYLNFGGVCVPEESVTRATDYTCDGCGMPVIEPVIVQAQFFPWHKTSFGLPQLHYHESCLIDRIPGTERYLKNE